jgi:hypothetical protein
MYVCCVVLFACNSAVIVTGFNPVLGRPPTLSRKHVIVCVHGSALHIQMDGNCKCGKRRFWPITKRKAAEMIEQKLGIFVQVT